MELYHVSIQDKHGNVTAKSDEEGESESSSEEEDSDAEGK